MVEADKLAPVMGIDLSRRSTKVCVTDPNAAEQQSAQYPCIDTVFGEAGDVSIKRKETQADFDEETKENPLVEEFVRVMKLAAEQSDLMVTQAVIAVENEEMEEDVRIAAKRAGIIILDVVLASTAAAVNANLHLRDRRTQALIVDAGETGCRFTVMSAHKGSLTRMQSKNFTQISGESLDKILLEKCKEHLLEKNEFEVEWTQNRNAEKRLLNECNRVKEEFTIETSAAIYVRSLVDDKDMIFDDIGVQGNFTEPLTTICEDLDADFVEFLGESKQEIKTIVFAGGCSQIPALREWVQKQLTEDPDEGFEWIDLLGVGAIAEGATILANLKKYPEVARPKEAIDDSSQGAAVASEAACADLPSEATDAAALPSEAADAAALPSEATVDALPSKADDAAALPSEASDAAALPSEATDADLHTE